uniref:Zinc finger MYM-type containing 2 n=1 Tax=Nothobranchius furzeri TaxID=105023 RepID=A0A8C6L903_NOTFU
MDGDSEPNPVVVEERGERVEPMDATPPHQQQTSPPSQESGEAVSMVTGDEATKQHGAEDNDDDDVVLVEEEEAPQSATISPPQDTPSTEGSEQTVATVDTTVSPPKTPASPLSSSGSTVAASQKLAPAAPEPIVIDDEEDSEQKEPTSSSPEPPGESSTSHSSGALESTELESELRITSVTTLGPTSQKTSTLSAGNTPPHPVDEQADMNLMITSVTSLQGESAITLEAGEDHTEENGLQISSAFSLNPDTPSARPTASFNPGRGSGSIGQLVQNGDPGTHNRADSWISQSASVPRNQKQTGADSPSLPKPAGQSSSSTSSSGVQTQPRTVKVTCANCKKPLKKGQTAYQRKGSAHLFCSTTCLSAFSHKPAPKKSCTMCKKDITNIKGTIVAQVDSSESFQEFCTTGCLGAYENKQNPPKSGLKTKCTVCGKLTEIRHEVSFKTVTHKICSDVCFNVYRRANGLIMNCCEQCGDYLPSRASANLFLLVDGQQKRFCCQNCIRDFKQANSKLATCQTCKTLIKTGEVLHSLGASGTMSSFCSVNCMHKSKLTSTPFINKEPTCHFCKRSSLPQYQATLPEGNVLNFCSSQCVTKFQNTTFPTTTNGQMPLSTTDGSVQLKCNYCRGTFSLKPEILEWEDKVYQFCSKTCCEDYKKLHCIVTFCENCQEEKTLHEMVQFSGVKRPFCSEGCKLLFKEDFIQRLGLKCVSCNHCSQLCKRSLTRQLGGMTRDFCSETCAKKFHDWYYKAARCDCCKVQGSLTESVMWRSEMKHFCDQECLLRFYCQQNEPIMVTQKGPENSCLGFKRGPTTTSAVAYSGGGLVRDVKNKAVLCKPLTLTKATYCKPHMQSKHLQTDVDDGVKREYIPVPIPVPVFIPVPMNMYSQVTPTPVSLPVPVPVPVFLPTTLQGAEEIVQTIRDMRKEEPTTPMKAELSVAETITDDDDDEKPERLEEEASCSSSEEAKEQEQQQEEEEEEEEEYDPSLDLEADFPQASDPVPELEGMDEDMGFSLPLVLAEEKEELEESTPRPQSRRLGNKRQAVEDVASSTSSRSSSKSSERRSLPLKARYGVNAWRRWALCLSDRSEDTKVKDDSKPSKLNVVVCIACTGMENENKGLLLFPSFSVRPKSSLLSLNSDELNVALSRFVKEVCRPNGERYSPDSILYLCLGIQQHLHAKGRKDDLFGDSCYQQFGEELNKVLKDWQPSVLPDGSLWGRVEEHSLWSSRHVGEQSPAALLRSLVYLNTKYFGLRTVEQHLRLSFANVYGPDTIHPVTKETTVRIRVPSISQDHPGEKRKRTLTDDEQEEDESSGGPAVRCPVKKNECRLYELYRSKCPTLLWERLDVFYVQPDPACSTSDALWFSSTQLERSVLESLLTRVLLVRDIYTDRRHLEDEDEEDGCEEVEGE